MQRQFTDMWQTGYPTLARCLVGLLFRETMIITGIVRDHRSRYLIRQRATGNNAKFVRSHTTVSSPFPPFPPFVQSFATYNALSSDKTSNIFTAHLPLARNVRIVHYSPFCLQIEWHHSRRQLPSGGLGYPEG